MDLISAPGHALMGGSGEMCASSSKGETAGASSSTRETAEDTSRSGSTFLNALDEH